MILFSLYAVAVWVVAGIFRRHWIGAAALLLSIIPIAITVIIVAKTGSELGRRAPTIMSALSTGYGQIWAGGGAVYAAAVFGVGLLVWVQKHRRQDHECQDCGYDLRGVPSGLCPECGRGDAALAEAR